MSATSLRRVSRTLTASTRKSRSTTTTFPDAGTYRGHEGYEQWVSDWAAAWDKFSIEPEAYIDAGERVVLVIRMTATGRGSGLELNRQDALVYTIRDAKVVRLDYYNSKAQALEAAGLSE